MGASVHIPCPDALRLFAYFYSYSLSSSLFWICLNEEECEKTFRFLSFLSSDVIFLKENEESLVQQNYLKKVQDSTIVLMSQRQSLRGFFWGEREEISYSTSSSLCRSSLLSILSSWGYERQKFCTLPRQYAIRGEVIDILTPLGELYRIYLDDTCVEQINVVDVVTQQSTCSVDSFSMTCGVDLNETRYSPWDIQKFSSASYVIEGESNDDFSIKQFISSKSFPSYRDVIASLMSSSSSLLQLNRYLDSDSDLPVQCFQKISYQQCLDWMTQYSFVYVFVETKDLFSEITSPCIPIQGSLEFPFALQDTLFLPSWCYLNKPSSFRLSYVKKELASPSSHQARSRFFQEDLKNWRDLQVGDYVVHRHHGIALYQGTCELEHKGCLKDFLVLEFKNNEKVYISIDDTYMVQRYMGVKGIRPSLSKLGGRAWKNLLKKTREDVTDLAYQLLKTAALRSVNQGVQYGEDEPSQQEFENQFPYEETEDQKKALADIKKDMQSLCPMDRLLCGDVGFGKTEVAMRAVFRAVSHGHQVAVMVPTTVLALQHEQTFKDRMFSFGVRIISWTRFLSEKEKKKYSQQIQEGHIDIVIGTYGFISQVSFSSLSLFIIDEEQKFGVLHKEYLKKKYVKIDVLSLSATPIPRTLYSSLVGIKDISLLREPPLNRKPIVTRIRSFDEEWIYEAISYELNRGGQVFFVHNRVKTLSYYVQMIRRMFPDKKVLFAHGQMHGDDLIKVMEDFVHNRGDILVASNIIGTGIDIPRVNTLIIHDAHFFGLSQLHQLRGRVGRSQLQAYCYCVVPTSSSLTVSAHKRLEALQTFSSLGAGYQLATQDLEIRGAGDLLGDRQHGLIVKVGFDLYCSLLRNQVRSLSGQNVQEERFCELILPIRCGLNRDFIEDTSDRLLWYGRVMSAVDEESLLGHKKVLLDFYGKLPQEAELFFQYARLRIKLSLALFRSVIVYKQKIKIDQDGQVRVEPFFSNRFSDEEVLLAIQTLCGIE